MKVAATAAQHRCCQCQHVLVIDGPPSHYDCYSKIDSIFLDDFISDRNCKPDYFMGHSVNRVYIYVIQLETDEKVQYNYSSGLYIKQNAYCQDHMAQSKSTATPLPTSDIMTNHRNFQLRYYMKVAATAAQHRCCWCQHVLAIDGPPSHYNCY